ncbi:MULTISPECIES: LxmA leader domain family RiPP [unclassified Streptosporangium]|uniref:LxmA leader domain family RiPP n=1 Tax=Streptosporangium sp. NPDC005286 TaxID=3154463 RepID=UPI0033AC7AFD
MSAELLLEGANAYTSLAEIATTPETDTPEATPITLILTPGAIAFTVAIEC